MAKPNQHPSFGNGGKGRLLVLGGTGFLSSAVARRAAELGFDTWISTRGHRSLPEEFGVLVADRDDAERFAQVMTQVPWIWEAVIDCTGFAPAHGMQDVAVFTGRARHLIFISSDAVYDPQGRRYPQPVAPAMYSKMGYGLGKLGCEESIRRGAGNNLTWTIVRPPHIYGYGSPLGCLPPAFRDPMLPQRILAREEVSLAGGGWFLHQPIHVDDLARLILSLVNLPGARGRCFNTPGPETITMRAYYEAIASALDSELRVREVSVTQYLADHPERASAVCHRLYDLSDLTAAKATLPSTTIADGMRSFVSRWRSSQSSSPPPRAADECVLIGAESNFPDPNPTAAKPRIFP